MMLKTKDNADHAGPSQQLLLLKVLTKLVLVTLLTSQNNNSLIVLPSGLDMEVLVAMVVLWTKPSNMLKRIKLKTLPAIHIKLKINLVPTRKTKELLVFPATPLFKKTLLQLLNKL